MRGTQKNLLLVAAIGLGSVLWAAPRIEGACSRACRRCGGCACEAGCYGHQSCSCGIVHGTTKAWVGTGSDQGTAANPSALIHVRVPSNAEVFINDKPTKSTGLYRVYRSQVLSPGETYSYEVWARIVGPQGVSVTRTDAFTLQAGYSQHLEFADSEFDRERPKTEQPKTKRPKTEQPKTEQPKTEQPKTEQPKTEQPKTEEPKTEEPKPEKTETKATN